MADPISWFQSVVADVGDLVTLDVFDFNDSQQNSLLDVSPNSPGIDPDDSIGTTVDKDGNITTSTFRGRMVIGQPFTMTKPNGKPQKYIIVKFKPNFGRPRRRGNTNNSGVANLRKEIEHLKEMVLASRG